MRPPGAASPTTRPSWSGRRPRCWSTRPTLLDAERDRCRHVYVDELADTDPAQIDLLGLVVGGGAHVVGLGDPDSSTFAFRGGDPTGMRDFTERFPTARGDEAPRITLPTNYRSVPELVDGDPAGGRRGCAGRSATGRCPARCRRSRPGGRRSRWSRCGR